MYLHVDMASGKVAAAAEDALQDLLQLAESHKELAMPEAAGRHVGQR
jgi:carnitine 3-dehydrogenase